MKDYFEELRERRRLGWSKMWLSYYLYLLKYSYIKNGKFDFNKFRNRIIQLPQISHAVQEQIINASDFMAIEKILWRLAEALFERNFCFHKDNLDRDKRIESLSAPKAIYIASKIQDVIDGRFGWHKSIDEVKKDTTESIIKDVERLNEVHGIYPISKKFVLGLMTNIAAAADFDALEIAIEKTAWKLWDSIEQSSAGILDGVARAGLEAPRLDENFYEYCKNLSAAAAAVEYCHQQQEQDKFTDVERTSTDVSDFYADK